jgi:uncharacterized protein (DUF2267 family)
MSVNLPYEFSPNKTQQDVLTLVPDSVMKLLADYLPPDEARRLARELYVELIKLGYITEPEAFNGREYVHSIKPGGLHTYGDEVR